MTSLKRDILVVLLIAVLVVAGVVVYLNRSTPALTKAVGTGNPIENYVPAVLYNGGLYSALPAKFNDTLVVAGAVSHTSTFTQGSSGTALTQLISGTGAFIGANLAQAATTSQAYDIAVSGVQVNDKVFVSLSTTTTSTNLGWRVLGASASSTSGYITVTLQNLTGGTQSIAAGGNAGGNSWGSSTQYWVVR